MAHETIEQRVLSLERGIADDAVVIGSSAANLALGDFREPHDLDLAVSEEAFRHLQAQPDWETTLDGRLQKDGFDVGMGWGGTMAHDGLDDRSWRTAGGVKVAGLADIYAYKQARDSAADISDTASIRTRLLDPGLPPLPVEIMPHEIAAVRDNLPEVLLGLPEAELAIRLAASGLHSVRTLYGHPGIGRANQIIGELELAEYRVPATYHNGFDLADDMRTLDEHLENIGVSLQERLDAQAAESHTDAKYGGGRHKDNPLGHDELLSANLLRAHALALGYSRPRANQMHGWVLDSTFDEETGTQRGTHSTDPVGRGIVGEDLQVLSEPHSAEATYNLAVENGFSARFSRDRTIGRVLNEHGVRVDDTLGALEAIDDYADARPHDAPDGPTVMQSLVAQVRGNADFHERHVPPADWSFDNPQLRHEHAAELRQHGSGLARASGAIAITAVQAFEAAQVHTAAMTARFGHRH